MQPRIQSFPLCIIRYMMELGGIRVHVPLLLSLRSNVLLIFVLISYYVPQLWKLPIPHCLWFLLQTRQHGLCIGTYVPLYALFTSSKTFYIVWDQLHCSASISWHRIKACLILTCICSTWLVFSKRDDGVGISKCELSLPYAYNICILLNILCSCHITLMVT